MMVERNIKRRAQILNGGKHFISIHGMLTHAFPFSFVERTWLLKDLIGDGDLAHIVKQGASFDVCKLFFAKPEPGGNLDGDLGDALGVSFRFAVS